MKRSRLAERRLGQKPKEKPKKWFFAKVLFLVLIFLIFAGILFWMVSPKNWDGKSKTTIVSQKKSGDVVVEILDPGGPSITTIEIPAETEVNAAHQLGSWKLGSITKLGMDEKLPGDFLKNTIVKSFNFPIENWVDGTSTNLSLLDRIRIGLFSFSVPQSAKFDIFLQNSADLTRSQLSDGSLGWKIAENVPINIESYFADPNTANGNLNVLINNASSVNNLADNVGKTVEVLGINVASVQNLPASNLDCKVTGLSKYIVETVARIFSCDTNFLRPNNNFDIEIDLGLKFKDRF